MPVLGFKPNKVGSCDQDPNGFYDLLWNVREYYLDSDSHGTMGAQLSSFSSTNHCALKLPLSPFAKTERHSIYGFRLVIEPR